MAACDVPGHLRRIQCCTISVVNLPDAGNGFLRLFVIIIVGGAPSILRAAFNLRMIQQVDVIVEDVLEPSVFIHQLSGVGSAIRCSLDDEICGAVIAIQSSGYLLTIGWVGKCWPENCVDVVSQQKSLPWQEAQQSSFCWGNPNAVGAKPGVKQCRHGFQGFAYGIHGASF